MSRSSMRRSGPAPLVPSLLSDRVVLRALAIVVFCVSATRALGVLLPAWGVPQQWPRAGVMSPAVFVAVFVAGLGVVCAGITVSRRSPLAAWAVTLAAYVCLAVVLDTPTWVSAGDFAVAAALCLLGVRASLTRSALALGVTLVVYGVVIWGWAAWRLHLSAADAGQFLLYMMTEFGPLVAAGVVLGALLGRLSRRTEAARREADAAQREHELSVTRAREAERVRVAQELHDVAAQHLAGLLSLADAAVDLADKDPSTALGLVGEVRSEGRFAAASIYSALGDLRTRGSEKVAPTPDARQVVGLVDRWLTRGMEVHLLTVGDLTDLPMVVSTSAFRVVQESLANAAKHAPRAPVIVQLRVDQELLTVVVENRAPTQATGPSAEGFSLGWGLESLRERTALLTGSFSAGPTPENGWRVSALLPLSEARSTAQTAHGAS